MTMVAAKWSNNIFKLESLVREDFHNQDNFYKIIFYTEQSKYYKYLWTVCKVL